jgi:colanic acid/amylovoran biosynthesis glycosyltransferase
VSRVLHHVQRWLPPTEGFVAAQSLGSAHRAVVSSREQPLPEAQARHRAVSLARVPTDRGVALALAGLAAATRADVVHVHFGYRLRDARHLRGRRPVVVSLHGHDATAFPRAWPSYYRGHLDRADAVVVPSRFLAERAEALGARADRLHVVPSGVDPSFTPVPMPPGPPEVVLVGRLVPKKGVDVLLDAWPSVRAAVPGARLLVVGDGPLADRVHGAGVQLQRGTAGRAQVRAALARATVVCTPSRTGPDGDAESLLLVNLEAQALGRPVVTTRHGGIPEFVDEGRSALLVPEGDPAALAEALVTVLRDPRLAERMAAAGPSVAARFPAAACAERVDREVYAPLLRG